MTTRTRTDILLIAGFCAFLFFYGMGKFGLIGADEPRYAQVAREMLQRGDLITPVLNGRPWLEKPPLYYWQAMLAYSLFGVSDTSARLPAAIDATLLVIAVYFFFRRFRPGMETDAALITASCAGIIGYSRAASTDIVLASTFSIGMLAWWAWRESEKKIFLAAFYVLMALGMLAKGPIAPFLAGIVIVVFAVAIRQYRLVSKTVWLPGIILFCAVAMPWYIAVQVRDPQFFREFILQHNLARFSSDLYHHRQPFWFYLPVTALALVPWVVFVAAAFFSALRDWWQARASLEIQDAKAQLSTFAVCWIIVPVVFFSLSKSKLPGYILPAIPAGAVLLVEYLRRHFETAEPLPKPLAVLHALVAASTIVPALLIGFLVTQHHLPPGRPLWIAVVLAVVLCIAIAFTLISSLGLRMFRFVTLIPVVLSVAAVLKLGSTAIDQTFSARPLAREIAAIESHPLPLAIYGVSRELEYGLTFYRNQILVHYEPGNIPAAEHLLLAPSTWHDNVLKETAGRRLLLLGHYEPGDVDYYWISATNPRP